MTRPAGDVLRADDWCVEYVEHDVASRFVERWHYSGGTPNTSTARHGLYRAGEQLGGLFGGDLWGVAMWLPPTRNAAASVGEHRGVLMLTRLAVHPDVPTNGASFLLASSMRQIDRRRWPTFLTYADTAHGHTGAIYRATGWICLGAGPAGDTWTDPTGRQVGRKRGGRNLTVRQMVDAGVRNTSAPKIKYAHAATRAGRRRLEALAVQ